MAINLDYDLNEINVGSNAIHIPTGLPGIVTAPAKGDALWVNFGGSFVLDIPADELAVVKYDTSDLGWPTNDETFIQ